LVAVSGKYCPQTEEEVCNDAVIFIQDDAQSHAAKCSTALLSSKGLKDNYIVT